MYPSEKKDMMLVFDESHRMLGTAAPKDIINNSREIDYDHNKAIIQKGKLKRILTSRQFYFNTY